MDIIFDTHRWKPPSMNSAADNVVSVSDEHLADNDSIDSDVMCYHSLVSVSVRSRLSSCNHVMCQSL